MVTFKGGSIKSSSISDVKIYSLSGQQNPAAWLGKKKLKSLRKDKDYQKRVELIQDLRFETATSKIKATPDGEFLIASGIYPPQVKVYELSQYSLKFERHLVSEIVDFQVLADDYSKIAFLCADRSVCLHAKYGSHYSLRIPRSPGKILSIDIPTFEALTQFGTAKVLTRNIGKLEASFSLTFRCLTGVSYVEEQFYIMKPEEVVSRSFYLYPTTDQAAKYECTAILKASDFSEVDRSECHFTTTATLLDNGSQIVSANESEEKGIRGIFRSIKSIWRHMWEGLLNFFSGKTCRRGTCSSFFDFSCHMQYICVSWILMFGLILAIFPTVIVLLWLLHQKGFFDPLYDWWDDRFGEGIRRSSKHQQDIRHHGVHDAHIYDRKHTYFEEKKRRSHVHHVHRRHSHRELPIQDHSHHSHLHVHKESRKDKHSRSLVDGHHRRKSSRDEQYWKEVGALYSK